MSIEPPADVSIEPPADVSIEPPAEVIVLAQSLAPMACTLCGAEWNVYAEADRVVIPVGQVLDATSRHRTVCKGEVKRDDL